jgi:hypothetical protein
VQVEAHRGVRIYKPQERPAVEVLVDDMWQPGEVRGTWKRHGRLLFTVAWRDTHGLTHVAAVPVNRVRRREPA